MLAFLGGAGGMSLAEVCSHDLNTIDDLLQDTYGLYRRAGSNPARPLRPLTRSALARPCCDSHGWHPPCCPDKNVLVADQLCPATCGGVAVYGFLAPKLFERGDSE